MSRNKLYIAAAGAGKTTHLVNKAIELCQGSDSRSIAIITYTQKNQDSINEEVKKILGYIPAKLKVLGWYTFLLDYCIRPFMGGVIGELSMQNVGMILVEGVSGLIKHGNFYYTTYAATDPKTRFLNDKNNFYSDKLSEFANLCYKQDKKVFMKRMSNIFSTIMIDEVQDMSAWDYEIISHLVKANSLYIELCGDLRQKTYSTTQSTKFKKHKGRIDLFLQKEVNTNRKTYIDIDSTTLNVSHRFGDGIADFANQIIGNEFPATRSCTCLECRQRQLDFGYDTGAFYIRRSDVFSFVETHNPLILTWDKNHMPDVKRPTTTYSKSKGMTVDVCLVYPTQTITNNFLKSSANKLSEQTRCKFYVAVTRARFISAIVVDDDFVDKVHHLPFWSQ